MHAIDVALVVVALASWLLTLVSSLGMLAHRDRSRPLSWFLIRSHVFFTCDGFTVDAGPWHRRLLVGVGLFVVTCGGGFIRGVMMAR